MTPIGRTVAVKRLRTDLASDTTFQARFRREAQSSASLNHPRSCPSTTPARRCRPTARTVAQPYIVMECVQGRTLRDIIREGRKILPERALEITSDVLAALDYSHRTGIIHRDIKPANVMLTPTGDVKVMDFGIARAVSDASSTMTQTAAVVGTAQYLSPEQARGETVDSRSDVYSTAACSTSSSRAVRPSSGTAGRRGLPARAREPLAPVGPRRPARGRDRRDRAEVPRQAGRGPLPELSGHACRHRALPRPATPSRRHPRRWRATTTVPATAATTLIPTTAATAATGSTVAGPPPGQTSGSRTGLMFLIGFLVVLLIGAAAYFLPKMFEQPVERDQVPPWWV
jgi:serine/threonine-protein kinase